VDVSRISESKAGQRNGAKAKFARFGEKITETKAENPKSALGSSSDEDGFSSLETSTIERRKEQNCLFPVGDYRSEGHKPDNYPGFKS
jgi:hypothetical protein